MMRVIEVTFAERRALLRSIAPEHRYVKDDCVVIADNGELVLAFKAVYTYVEGSDTQVEAADARRVKP